MESRLSISMYFKKKGGTFEMAFMGRRTYRKYL
jgi:hypothetical protein